jgi:hypothetical protein
VSSPDVLTKLTERALQTRRCRSVRCYSAIGRTDSEALQSQSFNGECAMFDKMETTE